MQRRSVPRQIFPGAVSLLYAQAEDGLTDAEGRTQIGMMRKGQDVRVVSTQRSFDDAQSLP